MNSVCTLSAFPSLPFRHPFSIRLFALSLSLSLPALFALRTLTHSRTPLAIAHSPFASLWLPIPLDLSPSCGPPRRSNFRLLSLSLSLSHCSTLPHTTVHFLFHDRSTDAEGEMERTPERRRCSVDNEESRAKQKNTGKTCAS